MGWEYLWILAVVAAVICAVGYYKFVYFLSIGYGFAVAGIGVALVVLFTGRWLLFIMCSAPCWPLMVPGFPAFCCTERSKMPLTERPSRKSLLRKKICPCR